MTAKPLHWYKGTDHPQDDDGEDAAGMVWGIGGRYRITRGRGDFLLWLARDEFVWTSHPTIKAAQDAAEADWQKAYAGFRAKDAPTP